MRSLQSANPLSWTLISEVPHSDIAFDTMTLHINSRQDRQRIDELGIVATWSAAEKRFAGDRFSLWWTEIVDSCQPFPAHHEFLVVFVAQSRFAGRLEVVADGFDRFFEKLSLVQTFGPGRIFSQRIRFENQHIVCGHAKVGLLRP